MTHKLIDYIKGRVGCYFVMFYFYQCGTLCFWKKLNILVILFSKKLIINLTKQK